MFCKTVIAVAALAAAVAAQSSTPVLPTCPATIGDAQPVCFAVPAAFSESGDLECYYSTSGTVAGCASQTALPACFYTSPAGALDADNSGDALCPATAPVLRRRSMLNLRSEAAAPVVARSFNVNAARQGKAKRARRAAKVLA